jgi:hypothetical protein
VAYVPNAERVCWILKEGGFNYLFQVEVIIGYAYEPNVRRLELNAEEIELEIYSEAMWLLYFDAGGLPPAVAQIPPDGYENVVPRRLVCFWFYMPNENGCPYTIKRYNNGTEVHVFSASANLRSLAHDIFIEIEMARGQRRLNLINGLLEF